MAPGVYVSIPRRAIALLQCGHVPAGDRRYAAAAIGSARLLCRASSSLYAPRKDRRNPRMPMKLRLVPFALAAIACPPPLSPNPRTARRCARSTSACRWRRRTWCTPPPMWRRRWAISRSAASTPTSCSSRAASRRPRRSRRRRARRSSASAMSRSAAASRCSRSGRSRRACRRPTWCRARSRPRRTLRASACPRPAAASAASTGGWAARCSSPQSSTSATRNSSPRRPRAACPA